MSPEFGDLSNSDFLDDKPHDECGVFGIKMHEGVEGVDAANITYRALQVLNHRGHDGAGISAIIDDSIQVVKDLGRVERAFRNGRSLESFLGSLSVMGHVRYATLDHTKYDLMDMPEDEIKKIKQDRRRRSLAPSYYYSKDETRSFAMGTNGQVNNSRSIMAELGIGDETIFTDTDSMRAIIGHKYQEGLSLPESMHWALSQFDGSFAMVAHDKDLMVAVRDSRGIKPLHMGHHPAGGYAFASEIGAFKRNGIDAIREVRPGEMVIVNGDGRYTSETLEGTEGVKTALCIFEIVYLSDPDTEMGGRSVHSARHRMGVELCRQSGFTPGEIDYVVPVPETSRHAAEGFAAEMNRQIFESINPEDMHAGLLTALVSAIKKNRHSDRSFIEPSQEDRQEKIRGKFSLLAEAIKGKRLLVVEDSIVRGNTSKYLIKMLWEAGAQEIHFVSASPPIKYTCDKGVDMATPDELLAAVLKGRNHLETVEKIRRYLNVSSLHYLELDRLKKSIALEGDPYCTACLDGYCPPSAVAIRNKKPID